jgi:hypothetical protein
VIETRVLETCCVSAGLKALALALLDVGETDCFKISAISIAFYLFKENKKQRLYQA